MAPTSSSDPFSVAGQNIVVVGGTAGIGQAVAAHLSAVGASVVITGRRDGADIAQEMGALFVTMDVADDASVDAGFSAIAEAMPSVDTLILNAGIDAPAGEIGELDVSTFANILDVNTMGVVRAMARGIGMVPDGGSVIVTSSPAGSVTLPGMAPYSASKAAVDMLVRTWALELGPRQVRVNAILPGLVESEMAADSLGELEMIRRLTANGIHRKAAEMGPVFQFMASPASVTLTGSLVGAHDGIPVGISHEVIQHLAADIEW